MCRDPECGICDECVNVEKFHYLESALTAECSELDQWISEPDGGVCLAIGGRSFHIDQREEDIIEYLVQDLNQHRGEWFSDLDQFANTVRYMTHNGFDPPGSEVYKHPAWFVCMRLQEIEDEKIAAKLMENNKPY